MRIVYESPMAEFIQIPDVENLLVSFSTQAGVEDWEEGDEL